MTASSEFLTAMAQKMPLHPRFIMSHIGKFRTNDEPLIVRMVELNLLDELDILLSLGLSMYEGITEDKQENCINVLNTALDFIFEGCCENTWAQVIDLFIGKHGFDVTKPNR